VRLQILKRSRQNPCQRIPLLKRYVSVKLPAELADEVDRILERKLPDCRSQGELVAEAVGDKLMQVKK